MCLCMACWVRLQSDRTNTVYAKQPLILCCVPPPPKPSSHAPPPRQVAKCRTLDQARAVVTFLDAASEKTLRSTLALTASRGRGKSAALGLAISGVRFCLDGLGSGPGWGRFLPYASMMDGSSP